MRTFYTLHVVKKHFYSNYPCSNLNCVRITGLSEDLQEGRIRHKEEPWEQEPLFLKVPVELDHIISTVHIVSIKWSWKATAYVIQDNLFFLVQIICKAWGVTKIKWIFFKKNQ